jgi:hypothetical protein
VVWKDYDHSPLDALWPRELVSSSVLEFQEKMADVAYSSRMAMCEKAMILKVISGLVKGAGIAMVWFPF